MPMATRAILEIIIRRIPTAIETTNPMFGRKINPIAIPKAKKGRMKTAGVTQNGHHSQSQDVSDTPPATAPL